MNAGGGRGWRAWALIGLAAVGLAAGYATRPVEEPWPSGSSAAAEPYAASAGPPSAHAGIVDGAGVVVRRPPATNPMLLPGTLQYNPAAAAMALELSNRVVFEAETRDAAFADRRERVVGAYISSMLASHGPGMELVGVECRSGSCRAVFDAPADEWSRSLLYYMAWGALTDVEAVEQHGGRVTYEVTTLMNHEMIDHDTYERVLNQWRTAKDRDLAALREQQVRR